MKAPSASESSCPICSGMTMFVGTKRGRRTCRQFVLHRCVACGFAFVVEPWMDYAQIYDEVYYEGRGSDPYVDYAYEFARPERTIRRYEWRGLTSVVEQLCAAPGKWLDFGCGNGGLVRHVRACTRFDIFGFDTGAWADKARHCGLPILSKSSLAEHEGTFDVVTAVEVIEHCVEPLAVLRQLRRLLKPGGVLVLTTGNADTSPSDFPSWYYVNPEIHVSYFSPRALNLALEQTGFAPFHRGVLPGWHDIIRFKILKAFRIRDVNPWERLLPWRLLTSLADRKFGLSAHPFGRAL